MDGHESLWWRDGVIYQVYPRSFQDSNGDGVGDLPGITSRLPYLQWLGVDAVWLSPFYRSPMADFGYDVADYRDVDPLFGTLADFDALLAEVHRLGMRLIVDWVPNHTSDQHPWFVESRSSRDNPKADWYIWADAKPDGGPPNNWLSNFGGGGWTWDDARGQYYLHLFLKEQPDLNWRNPEVEAAMLDVLRFWLERGVDGFRIDVAHMILKDPQLRDNPPSGVQNPARQWDAFQHVNDFAHPDVHEEFRRIRQTIDSYGAEGRPRVTIGEIYEYNLPVWAGYYGTALDELHMPFNFALLDTPWTAGDVRRIVDAIDAVVPEGAWPNYVLGNHDRPRVASRVGQDGVRVAMMLLLTLRGTPTVYYGDEIGMHNSRIPLDKVQDPWEKNEPGLGLGRDPVRTPMQWDAGANAGFAPSGVEPWLPPAEDYREHNVAVEREEPTSMLSLTRALLELRRSYPVLIHGSYRSLDSVPNEVFAYVREAGDARALVLLNMSGEEQGMALPDLGTGTILLSTVTGRMGAVDLSSIPLAANEGIVIECGALGTVV
jgi:alpha-glucosidase